MEEVKTDNIKNKTGSIIWILIGSTMVLNGFISHDNFLWFLISLFGAFIIGIGAKEAWPEIFTFYKNKDKETDTSKTNS